MISTASVPNNNVGQQGLECHNKKDQQFLICVKDISRIRDQVWISLPFSKIMKSIQMIKEQTKLYNQK